MNITGLQFPDPKVSLFSREEWGAPAQGYRSLTAPVHFQMVRAAEGLVLLCRCERCSGRSELLLDGRFNRKSWVADVPEMVEQRVMPTIEGFAEAHRGCADHPLKYELPGKALQLVKGLDSLINPWLAKGGDFCPFYLLLFKDRAINVPLLGMPNPDEGKDWEKRAYFFGHQTALRDHMRTIGLSPTAVIHVSVAWMVVTKVGPKTEGPLNYSGPRPSQHPDRQEVVSLAVATPTFARLGHYPLVRDVPWDNDSPGHIGPLAWYDSMTAMESRILEGLFALNDELPQDDEAKLRALGTSVILEDDEL